MPNKYCLFLILITLEMKLITNKTSTKIYNNKLSTSSIKSSTLTIIPHCHVSSELTVSRKILISPAKSSYGHNEVITSSCLSGYYFRKPKSDFNNTILENICLNGAWKRSLHLLPVCRAGCLQWSFQNHQWQPIHLLVQEEGSGFILSPDYPGDINDTAWDNCSFIIETKKGFLKLSVISLNIPNFFLEIITKDGTNVWHNASHHNQSYHLSGFKKFTIRLKRYPNSQRIRSKAENFKLFYSVFGTQCSTYVNDENVIINKTRISNVQTIETYRCNYPYTLIGPLQRACHEGVWITHMIPSCRFTCDAKSRLVVNKVLKIRALLKVILTCRFHVFSTQGNEILQLKMKRSATTLSSCLYVKVGSLEPVCFRDRSIELIFVSSTTLALFENTLKNSDTIELEFHTLPSRSCSSLPVIKNGYIEVQSSSLYSVVNVHCNSNHVLSGSSTMKCILDLSGNARWLAERDSECIKLCDEAWATLTISTSPMSIPVPPFFNLNFTENQLCKWNIRSQDFPPIISITSIKDIKEFINISVTTPANGVKQQTTLIDTFYKYQNETKMIFVCPEKVCSLEIVPRQSLNSFQKRIFIDISLKLVDKVPAEENSHGMFFLFLLMVLLLVAIFLVFFDYSRHPYTGYTIKFFNIFKSSKLKTVSTFSMHDMSMCRPISKTEAEIIVLYKNHHSDQAYIHIQRSLSCTEGRRVDRDTFRLRLNQAKRRFSDFTDLVCINYSMKSKREDVKTQEPVYTEGSNDAYEWEHENYI